MQYEICIIGAGPGGYETAVAAAKMGLSVAIVEKADLGGTCLNAGCIPTKCLCHTAEVLDEVKTAASQGIETGDVRFDLSAAIARKNEVIGKLQQGVEALMKTPGITLYRGEARLIDSKTVEVKDSSQPSLEGRVTIEADNIIIATGSVTKFLPIEGAHAEGVITSTEILNLTTLPQRLCIIGGGVIGMEFASIFNSFGTQVTVVEFCKEILPNFDKDIAKRLRTSLKKKGINFCTGAAAKSIKKQALTQSSPTAGESDCITVTYEEKGQDKTVEADLVLMAVGRAANTGALNLDDLGIGYTRRGITVDENMQTNIPGIYAIGDVNGLMQLAHVATAQGKVVLAHITKALEQSETAKPLERTEGALNPSIIPAAVFTVPEAAMVGKTEEQLTEEGVEYKAHKAFYRANGKALSMDAEDGLVKILASEDGTILGAHILGAHASDMIHEIAVLMNKGGRLQDIAATVHAHPSLSELILASSEG